jgi:hypothetical protein
MYAFTKGAQTSKLFLDFRQKEESWSDPVELGKDINANGTELIAKVSPDGKFLFFQRKADGNTDIFWVDAQATEAPRTYVRGIPQRGLKRLNKQERLRNGFKILTRGSFQEFYLNLFSRSPLPRRKARKHGSISGEDQTARWTDNPAKYENPTLMLIGNMFGGMMYEGGL